MIHSPLPPEPPASIETINENLKRVITISEITAARVEHFDDRISRVEKLERGLRSIALRLTGAALTVMAPTPRWLATTAVGSFVGGLVGMLIWQWLHSGSALARP